MDHTAKPVIDANDTSVLITARSINELQIKAKTTLDRMSEWFLVNRLTHCGPVTRILVICVFCFTTVKDRWRKFAF
jgi:hypothetical protein